MNTVGYSDSELFAIRVPLNGRLGQRTKKRLGQRTGYSDNKLTVRYPSTVRYSSTSQITKLKQRTQNSELVLEQRTRRSLSEYRTWIVNCQFAIRVPYRVLKQRTVSSLFELFLSDLVLCIFSLIQLVANVVKLFFYLYFIIQKL